MLGDGGGQAPMGRSISVLWLAVRIGCGGAAVTSCGKLQPAGGLGIGGVREALRVGLGGNGSRLVFLWRPD
jgi:hypothetical protein